MKQTVNTYLVKRLGITRALYVETFVMLWSMFEATEGREPRTVDELAEAIGKNRSTVFRWQADFREAFPEYSTPRDLLDALNLKRGKALNMRQIARLQWAG